MAISNNKTSILGVSANKSLGINYLSPVITSLFILSASSASAQQEVDTLRQIASEETVDIRLSSDQAILSGTVENPAASFIKVHLTEANLADGDKVIVSGDNNQRYEISSADLKALNTRDVWALSIMGNQAEIVIEQTEANKAAGNVSSVRVDQYMRGFNPRVPLKGGPVTETVCGQDDRREAACFQSSEPTAFSRSNAVARLVMPCEENGQGGMCTCTAWRVGPNPNTLITNNHCISDDRQISRAEVRFNFQNSTCNGNDAASRQVIVPVDEILVTHFNLDMSLITVRNASNIARFGALELDDRVPQSGEEIYIPQHPGGRDKELAVVSDVDGGNCRVDRAVTAGRAANTDLSYSCDTEGGSSGSPVLARSSHRVIGLHHFGRCNNRGVRIDRIADVVGRFLTDTSPAPSECSDPINFTNNTTDFSSNAPGSAEVSSDGTSITLRGNEWRITNSQFDITADTEVRFDFSATNTAEIIGVGFDSDNTASSNRIFRLGGTQNFGISGFSYTGNGDTQSFTIPVGESFTGSNMGFVIANDKDAGTTNNTVTVSNVRICQ